MYLEPKNGDFERYLNSIEAETLARLQARGLGTVEETLEASTGGWLRRPQRRATAPFEEASVPQSFETSVARAPQAKSSVESVLSQFGWGKKSDTKPSAHTSNGGWQRLPSDPASASTPSEATATPTGNAARRAAARARAERSDAAQGPASLFFGIGALLAGLILSIDLLKSGFSLRELLPMPGLLVPIGIFVLAKWVMRK